MMNFCTLFDSNYLDKALALYNSLVRSGGEFCLYSMCFDDKSYNVLSDMNLSCLIPEKLENFETEELLEIKQSRTKAEYCWTCTPAVIEYFMKKYSLAHCVYIDADLYFFANPQVLFDEITDNKADIAIIEHRFSRNKSGEKAAKISGKYCVEFNYFNSSDNAAAALSWWKQSCLEWCYHKSEAATEEHPARYGDQKYLEQFPIMFDGVHEIGNLGAGVAPWNLKQYSLVENNDGNIILKHGMAENSVELVFYHFQNLKYINHDVVNINSLCKNKQLKYSVYYPYLIEIADIRERLAKEYDLNIGIKKSYSGNKLKAFIQRNIMPYRVRTFSDIVNVKKLRESFASKANRK